jgi:hypothetical protein
MEILFRVEVIGLERLCAAIEAIATPTRPPANEPAAPAEEPAAPVEEPAAPVEEPAAPVEEPAAPVETRRSRSRKSSKAAPAEELPPAEVPPAEEPPAENTLVLVSDEQAESLREPLKNYLSKYGRDRAVQLLAEYDAVNVSTVPAAHYESLLAALGNGGGA